MNPKRFLVHVVQSQPRARPEKEIREVLTKHIRETLSRENLTKKLKEHRMKSQRNQALLAQLVKLEEELNAVRATHGERVRKLSERVHELRKKL